jgi:hypothetical protein
MSAGVLASPASKRGPRGIPFCCRGGCACPVFFVRARFSKGSFFVPPPEPARLRLRERLHQCQHKAQGCHALPWAPPHVPLRVSHSPALELLRLNRQESALLDIPRRYRPARSFYPRPRQDEPRGPLYWRQIGDCYCSGRLCISVCVGVCANACSCTCCGTMRCSTTSAPPTPLPLNLFSS